tara:strand:- start:559 stop:795 length:237 start_codon:yes stop_codon:yes gene_type:complete
MENTFLAKLNNYVSSAFEKIAIIRTRQALISLDDRTLAEIGYTRQQVLNGNFYNVSDVVDFPDGKLGAKNSIEEKKAA